MAKDGSSFHLRKRPIRRGLIATCYQVNCDRYENGFGYELFFDHPNTPGWIAQLRSSGKHYQEIRLPDRLRFEFPPGQECFETHYLEFAQLHIVRDADALHERPHTRPEFWAEEMQETTERIVDRRAQG